MNGSYLKFLSSLFNETDGYIPFWPMDKEVVIGDLLIMIRNKVIKIGNIMDMNLANPQRIRISPPQIPLKEAWSIKDGINFTLSTERTFFEDSTAVYLDGIRGITMEFEYPGAFFFQANEVSYKFIENFEEISFQLLQFLASEEFSFKEIYIVSSTAYVRNLGLAIASRSRGKMFITHGDGSKVTPIMSSIIDNDVNWDIKHAYGVEHIQFENLDQTVFFKAKKLEFSPKGKEKALKYILNNLSEGFLKHLSNIKNYSMMDMLPSSQIYPASVHEYFHFRDLNQNDIYSLLNG